MIPSEPHRLVEVADEDGVVPEVIGNHSADSKSPVTTRVDSANHLAEKAVEEVSAVVVAEKAAEEVVASAEELVDSVEVPVVEVDSVVEDVELQVVDVVVEDSLHVDEVALTSVLKTKTKRSLLMPKLARPNVRGRFNLLT